ncbi:hypothetical protein COX97_04865 [Candidatus Pacearchaeota archaeon CG_4_10_14_0_2_um_filter_05_32_18]|nr:MAG: hypothetical protein AUJ62_02640 [Candidatus Pacearchaeota archaeon CG1_02_32_21]PIZ82429.1 MAG: hypothetical protein COX97_04865 [Candidatus Pacearchaeota archaeon CG_4_10_14_0_2_um_filter_05_32_18]
MKKRGIYFLATVSLLVIVFGIIGVLAQSSNDSDSAGTCSDSQAILTLSKLTNAHAGTPDQSNHSVSVCYNSVFNRQYTGPNPSVCKNDSSNLVLILSAGKNAHAKAPGMAINSGEVPVCYGDLSCRVVEGECNSSIGEKRIVGLSDYEDAHLSLLKSNNYGKNICCTTSSVGGNASLSISISKPKMWENFTTSQVIDFEVEIANSSSLGSDVDIIWNFGDGNSTSIISCISKGKCNIKHIYTEQAHYTINANAKKQNSGQTSNDHVDILVYSNGLNKFAIISEPEFGQVIPSSTPVSFNGNQSFISQCGNSCPAGKECYIIPNSQLICYSFAKPGRIDLNETLGSYLFWFNWTFDRGKGNADDKSIMGTWNFNYTDVVAFDRTFFAEGNHTATLMVGYESTS